MHLKVLNQEIPKTYMGTDNYVLGYLVNFDDDTVALETWVGNDHHRVLFYPRSWVVSILEE